MGADSEPAFELRLLGGFDLRRTSRGRCRLSSKRAKALLCYLAVRHDRPSTREKLAGLLWDRLDPTSARNNLRQVLFAIRHEMMLEDNVLLLAAGDSLALNEALFQVDVWEFERLLAERTPESLFAASRLYRGELLEGLYLREFAFQEWLTMERERFRSAALWALGQVLDRSLAAGMAEPAQEAAIRILTIDAVDEAAHRALMVIYAREHRYALALRQYQICREVLKRDLGIEPDMETRALHSELLRQRQDRRPLSSSGRPVSRSTSSVV